VGRKEVRCPWERTLYFALRSHGIFHQGGLSFSSSIVGLFATNSWVASHLKSLLAETPPRTLHVPAPWLPIIAQTRISKVPLLRPPCRPYTVEEPHGDGLAVSRLCVGLALTLSS
jgi:hypothetical protein